jgi:hypothetical protein
VLLESAAVDFVRDAFGHLKAIAAAKGAQTHASCRHRSVSFE